MKIVYVHGFASVGQTDKVREIAKQVGHEIIAPDFAFRPKETIEAIHALTPDILIGSSLGGFYAHLVSMQLQVPAILINPAIAPWEIKVGEYANHYTGEMFHVTPEAQRDLRDLGQTIMLEREMKRVPPTTVLLGELDTVVDPFCNRGIYSLLGQGVRVEWFRDQDHRFNSPTLIASFVRDFLPKR